MTQDPNQRKYHLLVFKFNYTDDLTCLWPLFIDISDSIAEKANKRLLTRIISELETYPGVSKVKVIHNKLAYIEECESTVNGILTNNGVHDASIAVKYLQLEVQKLSENFTGHAGLYASIRISKFYLPVRVRSDRYPFLLDELELPVVVINDQTAYDNI